MKISVIGLGFVGTVTAGCLASRGCEVIGVDTDRSKVETLSCGLSPVLAPGIDELVAEGARSGHLGATCDLEEAIDASDLSMICIGLVTAADGSQDLAPLDGLVHAIGGAISRKGRFHSVVVRSTVVPTTTRKRLLPILEGAVGPIGARFGLAHHPEFMRAATAVSDFQHASRIIIGALDDQTAHNLVELYEDFAGAPFRTTPEMSEAIKYADNAWHALKVAFANEIGTICSANQIDGAAVMDLFCADTELNISRAYLRPGFGFGGACLSKDLRALVHWGAEAGLKLPLLSNVNASNECHVRRSVDWLLNSGRQRFALMGLASEPGLDDLRSSPFLQIARQLRAAGRESRAYDPDVSKGRSNPSRHDYVDGVSGELDSLLADDLRELVEWSDAVVMCSQAPPDVFSMIDGDRIVLDFARIATARRGEYRYHAFV